MINNDSKSSVIGYRRRDNSPTVETTVLGSSEPISPTETQTHTRVHAPQLKIGMLFSVHFLHTHTHTCVSSAGGPLRGHAVSLQVCV